MDKKTTKNQLLLFNTCLTCNQILPGYLFTNKENRNECVDCRKISNKMSVLAKSNFWLSCNLEEYKRYMKKQKRKERPLDNLRKRIKKALNGKKVDSYSKLINCSPKELRQHLEAQFMDGMTWENYGQAWHIDHIIPIVYFKKHSPELLYTANSYSNLQPLWAEDNLKKGSRIL